MEKQLTFIFDYGVTPEQACIMCHLSSECSGCCVRCHKGCEGQRRGRCAMGSVDIQRQRMYARIAQVRPEKVFEMKL